MKILALVTDAFGGFGGIAAYNRHFLHALASGGHEVTVLPGHGQDETPDGIRQLPPQSSKLSYIIAVFRILLSHKGYDLVWCGHIGLAPLARLAALRLRCPWWLQIHGIDAWDRPGRLKRWAVRSAVMVTAVSRYTRRRFLAWASLSPETVRVLPNTIDDRFTPGPKPEELVQLYGLTGKRVLLTVGRISAAESYKGHDRVIALLPKLLEAHRDVVYVIAGDGDGRPALERLAASLGVEHACRFIGKTDEHELVDLYRIADLFVMPSTGEGFGIVYLEAMACGIPAVGLDRDGSVDPLEATCSGVAVPADRLLETLLLKIDRPEPPAFAIPDLERFGIGSFREQVARLTQGIWERPAA